MVEALKGKPGLMKQLKSIFDDLHGSREFSVYPEFPRLFADPESSDWKNIDRIRQELISILVPNFQFRHILWENSGATSFHNLVSSLTLPREKPYAPHVAWDGLRRQQPPGAP